MQTSSSLYRKYRSQTFDELVGQEPVVRTLKNAIAADRISHAYLFTGPRGVGKTSAARLLARAANCTATKGDKPCNKCPNCLAGARETVTDLIEIDAASHTGVDNVREIIERANFAPSIWTRKFYVIDECFRYDDLVTMADGSKHPIGKIVENGWTGEVLSYNEQTKQVEPKPIVRHMKKTPAVPMVRITFDNNRALVCTLNHKFYTPQGQLHAGQLDVGQFVYANYERITQHQLETVAGAALGDGHLSLTGSQMRGRLSITQGVDQQAYLLYKSQLLGDLVQTPPRYQYLPQSYSKKGTYRLSTVSRPQIAELHRELYGPQKRKHISRSYLDRLTPLGLALWYLDDGSLTTQNYHYTRKDGSIANYPCMRSTLSVNGFTIPEASLICEWLQGKWAIESRACATAKGPVIWLTLAGTDALHRVIAPYIPPEMTYKLLPAYRNQFRLTADDSHPGGLAVTVVKKVERVAPYQFVYNIEVADNHNYFARDVLVSNCHMLSTSAFNALLKTLEEPPPHTSFILATTEVHKVPATVASRCQRFDFRRVPLKAMVARLEYICGKEGIEAEPAALEMVARQATGSLRDALSLLDQLRVFSDKVITAKAVQEMLGAGGSEEVAAFVDELLARDLAAGLRRINAALEEGLDLRQFNRQVVDHLRGLMLVKSGAAAVEGSLLEVTDEMRQRMQKQSEGVSLAELLRWVRLFGDVDASLRSTAYGQLPLEMAFVAAVLKPEEPAPPQQAAPDRKAELAEAAQSVGQPPAQRTPRREASENSPREATLPPPIHTELGSAMGNGASPDPAPQDTMPEEPAPIEVAQLPEETNEPEAAASDASTAEAPDEAPALQASPPATQKPPPDDLPRLVASWNTFVDQINARSPKMASMFEDRELVRPVAVTNGVCILSFRWPLHAKSSMSDTPHPRRTVIETALSRVLGYPCRLQSVTFEQEEAGIMEDTGPPSASGNERKGKRDKPAPHETTMGKAALNIFGIDKFDET